MNLNALTASTDIVWAAANDALDLASLSEQQEKLIVDIACLLLARRAKSEPALTSPAETRNLLRMWLGNERNEVFVAVYLDNQNRVIEMVKHFYGTVDSASVYPRVIVQKALEVNAAAIVFAHNHPSGVCEPSNADRHITQRLCNALELVDIRVLDHMVVGCNEIVSFAERGLI